MIGQFRPSAPRPLSWTNEAQRTWYTPRRIAAQAQSQSSMLLPGAFPSPTALAVMVTAANGQHLIYSSKTFGVPV